MFKFLKPDYYFHSVHDISLSFFKENGIKGILFDIDNTLEPYATPVPSEKTKALFEKLKEAGIKIAVISNNHEPRVKMFCQPLDVYYSFDSAKPSRKNIEKAMKELGVNNTETVIVGDQLFTDIWCANNSKIRGIFVDKINSDESLFIKMKRVIEIPFVKRIKKKGYGKID